MTQELPGNKFAGCTTTLIESPIILGGSGEIPFEYPGFIDQPIQFRVLFVVNLHQCHNDKGIVGIICQSMDQLSKTVSLGSIQHLFKRVSHITHGHANEAIGGFVNSA